MLGANRALLLVAPLLAAACGTRSSAAEAAPVTCDEAPSACPFVWTDTRCAGGFTEADSAPQPAACDTLGDGKRYRLCDSSSDCVDPAAPNCSNLGLWAGGDVGCAKTVRVCREKATDDCAVQPTPCPASAPSLGSTCELVPLSCFYGSCLRGDRTAFSCQPVTGIWVKAPSDCS
jgi:hypothetical protein